MAKKPKKVRWSRKGHTEAKHQILTEYLAAWIPILGQLADVDDLILIDGFAGPGRYEGGEKGSPLLMLDAYARRRDRQQLDVRAHFFFIEGDADRAKALQEELDKRRGAPDIECRVIQGDYEVEFPRLLDELDRHFPKRRRAIFSFIDPFGAEQNRLELTHRLLDLPRGEVLVFVPLTHFARFINQDDVETSLNTLFGSKVWKTAGKLTTLEERLEVLVELFCAQLGQACQWVRAFEIVPARGGNSHFLFFGTNSKRGLERMKEAMWKLDPVGGQMFRDSTLAGQPVLFSPTVDTGPLLQALNERFGTEPFKIQDALDFTLCETPYLPSHVKQRTLAPAERRGEVEPVSPKPGRRARTYPPGTQVRFVD